MKRILVWSLVIVLLLAMGLCVVACEKAESSASGGENPPATVEDASKKLRAAGYRVDSYEYEESDEEVALYGVVCELLAETEGEADYLEAAIFESEEKAKSYLQTFREEYEEECEEDREDGEDVTYGQSGKWVYYGTKNAVKTLLK